MQHNTINCCHQADILSCDALVTASLCFLTSVTHFANTQPPTCSTHQSVLRIFETGRGGGVVIVICFWVLVFDCVSKWNHALWYLSVYQTYFKEHDALMVHSHCCRWWGFILFCLPGKILISPSFWKREERALPDVGFLDVSFWSILEVSSHRLLSPMVYAEKSAVRPIRFPCKYKVSFSPASGFSPWLW